MKESATQPANAVVPVETVEKPDTESIASSSSKLNRNFASVPLAAPGNGDQHEALRLLAHDLASKLGIRPDQFRIRVDSDAQLTIGSRNAQGIARNGVIYLRSESFDPTSRTGRRLIAHEAAHIAQALLPGATTEPIARTRVPAEIEADVFAEHYATRRFGKPVKVPIPPSLAAADKDYKELVDAVAKSRSQEIARIIDLLSYGFFDWAVTNGDVFDALHILSMFPMLTARAIAHHIGEKYRGRLFSNLNPPHYAAHRPEILALCWAAENENEFESTNFEILNLLKLTDLEPLEAVAVNYVVELSPKVKEAAVADEKRAARITDAQALAQSERGTKALAKGLEESHKEEEVELGRRVETEAEKKDQSLNALITKIKNAFEAGIDDDGALELLDAIAEKCLPVANPADKFQLLSKRLDIETLDELIDQIPSRGLYISERRRKSYVYLVATRPAFKNEQIAENLMSSPWWQFWDTVTSEEAFLAFLLVKSMPARARTAFLKARGGEKWNQVIDELPQNIRESASFNFYQGGTDEKDRQAVFTELIDAKIWTAAEKDRLDAVIRIARAAGESEFVFEQSKAQRADKVPELTALIKKYELFVEGERETFKETPLEGHRWYEEGIVSKFAGAYRFMALLFGLRNISLGGEMGANLNLNDLHAYGGVPFTGDQFAPLVRGARFHETTRKERNAAYDAGWIPMNVARGEKHDSGELILNLPNLLIDQLSLAGDTTVTAAPVACSGFYLSVKYTPGTYEPLSLDLKLDELTLSDCAIVKGDSIYSVNSFKLTNLHLLLTNAALDKTGKKDGLGAMFSALLDPQQAQGVSLSFSRLEMNGVATSGGLFVQQVEIDGLSIQAGGNASAYMEALESSLKRLTTRIEEETQAAKDDPEHASEHEKAKVWLEKQRDKIVEEQQKGQPHGSVVDIKSIRVTGVPGVTEKGDPLVFNDVHGQGQSVSAVVPLFADPTSIRNMIRGSEAAPTVKGKLAGEEEFTIGLRDFQSKKPLRLAGSIPSADKAKQEFEEYVRDNKASRFKEGYQAAYDALNQRMMDAAAYQSLASQGVQNLKPEEAAQFRRLRRELTEFEERRALVIASLALEGVTLNISGSGNPELIAETLSASGIKTFTPDGRQSLNIDAVSGKGVSVSAAFTGGLANAKDWRKNLQSATLKADQLTLTGIGQEGSGAIIKELTFEGTAEEKGLEATLNRNEGEAGGVSVDVKSRRLIATGVSIPAHAALLRAERQRIAETPPEQRSPEEAARLLAIDDMLADLDRIAESKHLADASVTAAKSPKQKAAAQKQVSAAEDAFKEWQDRLVVNKLTIEHLDISLSGLGDALAEGYSFSRDAKEYAIEGKGKDGHLFEQATFEGIHNRTAKGDQVVADKVVVGPTGGKLKKLEKGYALEGFSIASLAVSGVTYVSGAMKVQAIGETTLLGISIDATYIEGKDQSDISLTKLRIENIVANNLKYEDADKVVTVLSGELIGLDLSGMNITLPNDPKKDKTIDGTVKLDAVKSLALSAVAGGYHVDATLNADKPKIEGGIEAHALTVSFAKSGGITVALKGLSASADVKQLGTGNQVHVEWKNLGGTIVKNGDNYSVQGLTIGNLTLSRLDWQVGTKTITIDDKVTLTGIALDLEASLQAKKKGPGSKPLVEGEEPEKELSKLLIKKLSVQEIDAKNVGVKIPAVAEDKALKIEASPFKGFHLEQAIIRGLTVTGFDVLNMQGKVEVKKSVSVTNLRATVGDIAAGQFKLATASFHMSGKDAEQPGKEGRELSATLLGKDGTIIKLGRTDSFSLTDIWANDKKAGKKGTETTATTIAALNLKGITAGDLIIKDEYVEISDIEIEGPIGIIDVNWNVTGADPQTIHMDVATLPELLKIGKVRADFKAVPTGKIVDGKEEKRSELNQLSVSGLTIPKIVGSKLNYKGPLESAEGVKTVELEFPTVMMNGVQITNLSKNFTDNLLTLDATIKSAAAPNFTAKLMESVKGITTTQKFGADITTGEIRADAILKTTDVGLPTEATDLQSGYYQLSGLGLRNVVGTLSETGKKDKTIGNWTSFGHKGSGVDVATVRKDKAGTTVSGTSVHGVTYSDPNMGLLLDIQDMTVPGTITMPKEGPITVPEATVTNAYFKIDDILNMGSSGGGAGPEIGAEQFYNMLDHVNGNFKADVYVPIHLDRTLGGPVDLRQDVFPVDMPIKNGKFNYENAWSRSTWIRNDLLASLQMDTDARTDLGDTSAPDWSASYLTLEVGAKNIIEWTPGDDAERKEMMDDKEVRLKRIIRPDDKQTAEEKAKAEADKKADLAAGEFDYVRPEEIELRNLAANLGIAGYIPLDLGTMGRIGLGTKGGDAVTELKLGGTGSSKSKLLWTLEHMGVTVDELNFGTTRIKGDKPGGAEIHINGVEGGSLEFTDGKIMQPKALEGTVKNATVKNLAIESGKK